MWYQRIIFFNKKIETHKIIQALRKEHTEIKKGVNDFKRIFDSAQVQIQDRVTETIQKNNDQAKELHKNELIAQDQK